MTQAFRRIQIGEEVTKGTQVAAADTLFGNLSITPNITFHRPEDERNSLAQYRRAKAISHMSSLKYESSATFEQLRYFLAMLLRTPVIATPTGATKTRDYTYTPSLSSRNTQKTYTIRYGDDLQAWRIPFVFAQSLRLGIAFQNTLSLSVDMVGQFPTHGAPSTIFTSNIAESTVSEILSDGAKLYVDDAWADLGTTQRSSMLAGGTINLNSGLMPVRYARGLTTIGSRAIASYHALSEQRRSHSLDMDIIVSANAISDIYNAYLDSETKAVRLEFADAGTAQRIEATDFYRTLTIDMAGKFTSEPELFGDRDGEDMFRITFTSHDDGSGNELSAVLRLNNDDI